jgi:hypothetical protein
MVSFKAFEEGIEVNGQTINSVLEGLYSIRFVLDKFFVEAGYPKAGEIDPTQWYSQQQWLDIFRIISEKIGSKAMFKIGKKIPENAEFPPEIDNIEIALSSIDIAYHMNHRTNEGQILFDIKNGKMYEGIGHYWYKKIKNKNKIIMKCENPYDCDFDRGIITAMANKFNPTAKVVHDDSNECRKYGKNSCTYIVEWE